MPGSLIGTVVRRVEDPDLVRGLGIYVDDLPIDGLCHLAFVPREGNAITVQPATGDHDLSSSTVPSTHPDDIAGQR